VFLTKEDGTIVRSPRVWKEWY